MDPLQHIWRAAMAQQQQEEHQQKKKREKKDFIVDGRSMDNGVFSFGGGRR